MEPAVIEREDVMEVDLAFPGESEEAVKQVRVASNRGRTLIDLNETFLRAGRDEAGLPELAIARAGREVVEATVSESTARFETWERTESSSHPTRPPGFGTTISRSRVGQERITVPIERGTVEGQYQTNVAEVPPKIRDKYSSIEKYHILFEVEQWSAVPQPVVDPFLLDHVAGSVWAVLEQWDLTAVEAASISRLGTPHIS